MKLGTKISEPLPSLFRYARLVQKEYKKNVLSQLFEIMVLGIGANKITPREYYIFQIYDDKNVQTRAKKSYVGSIFKYGINYFCNDLSWRVVAEDKLLFASYFRGLGFPVGNITAIYHKFRAFGSVPAFHEPERLKEFLRTQINYPVFCKPVSGNNGIGAFRLEDFDRTSNEIVVNNGLRVSLDEFVSYVMSFSSGYLFQELLRPHGAIREICGESLATVRLVVLLSDTGPEIIRSVLKIPCGANVVDNFSHGSHGNLVGAVNAESGCVERVVQGIGPDQVGIQFHPDTNRSIQDFTIPYWSDVKSLCLAAAIALPGMRTQAWDIAVCPDGPVLVEANFDGDYGLIQWAFGEGVLDDKFRYFLDSYAPTWRSVLTRRLFARGLTKLARIIHKA